MTFDPKFFLDFSPKLSFLNFVVKLWFIPIKDHWRLHDVIWHHMTTKDNSDLLFRLGKCVHTCISTASFNVLHASNGF